MVTEAFLPLLPGALTVYAAVDWYRGKQWIALRKTGQAGYSAKSMCIFFGAVTLVTLLFTWGK